MSWQRPSSSALAGYSYVRTPRVLWIKFVDGSQYKYMDVSPSVYADLHRASSKGRFFNERIRDGYHWRQHRWPSYARAEIVRIQQRRVAKGQRPLQKSRSTP